MYLKYIKNNSYKIFFFSFFFFPIPQQQNYIENVSAKKEKLQF